jgi:hypothetical protein
MILAYICVVLMFVWSISLETCSILIPLFNALVAKLCRDKLNEKDDFDFSPFFLSLFYTSNAYDDCCFGKKSNFYTFTTESKFEFVEGFEKKQEILREFLKSNEKKFQTIKKQWKNGRKETVTISAVSIKAKICSCKISDNKRYDFESVTLPQSDFELNNEFWKTKNARHLEKDYSSFESKY